MTVNQSEAEAAAICYARAWSSRSPKEVASFFSEDGCTTINTDQPFIGRAEVAEMARSFFKQLSDIIVHLNDFQSSGNHAILRWTLEGRNTGPGGTGNYVKISGWEYWRYSDDGLIAESFGHFDAEDYERQLNPG